MADRTYVYIDGESHYLRSEQAWRKIHGPQASLDQLRYANQADEQIILVHPKAKVFWTRRMNPGAQRTYYFTSAVGDDPALHEIKVTLRDFELEPIVIQERNQLAKRRQNALQAESLIEKPKGVDIELAVRMLLDAFAKAYDVCHLYTSDIDFLPVIQAVRAQGMRVFVHGYIDGLSQQSPFLHACDLFTDLDNMLRNECRFDPSQSPSSPAG